MSYEKCARCDHTWHGLPCVVRTTYLAGQPGTRWSRANCPSAFDDDYWNEGA